MPFSSFVTAARRLSARLLFGALTLAIVEAGVIGTSEMATVHATAPAWLDRFNAWRANAGVPLLTEDATYDAGDVDHAVYMVKNDLVTHYETPGTPYYTAAGDTAARNSNIYVSSSTSTTDTDAIDWWMQAPFHAMGMMDPRLRTTGFGSYRESKSGWDMGAAVNVVQGNSFTGGAFPVFFPGNGTTVPLASYGGGEYPDPLTPCSAYAAPTGLPLWVETGGNVFTNASLDSFTGNGVALPHCVIDSNNPSLGSYLTERGAVIVIPKAPLQTGVKYVVGVTVNGVPYTWSFSIGTLSKLNPNACTSASGVTVPALRAPEGTHVTITGAAAGCPSPQFRFWVLPPGGPWQMVQDYGVASSFTWTAPPTPGVYHLEVDARDATSVGAYDAAATILYTVQGCTSAWLTAGLQGPQVPGTTVTFNATSTTCAAPLYKFFLQPPGGSWAAQTAFGSGTSWAWNTSGLAPGTYGVGVWANTTGSTASYEAYWLGTYTLANTPCSAASVSTGTASPQAAGASITFTATGCPGAQFRFWTMPKGGSWTMQRDYGAGSWTWNTTGLAPGTYEIGVWSRVAGSANQYDAYGFTTFVLGAGICNSTAMTPNLATPQAPGANLLYTATSNGCTGAQYAFWLMPPGGSWTLKQSYSTSATFAWDTTGYAAGTYQVGVWAKASGSANSYDAFYIGTYQLQSAACSAANVLVAPASPQAAGTAVTFTATATGCAGASFEFWELPPPGTTWSAVRAYGSGNTFVWDSVGASGPYRFGVWVRQSGSTASYEAYAIVTYWVT